CGPAHLDSFVQESPDRRARVQLLPLLRADPPTALAVRADSPLLPERRAERRGPARTAARAEPGPGRKRHVRSGARDVLPGADRQQRLDLDRAPDVAPRA